MAVGLPIVATDAGGVGEQVNRAKPVGLPREEM